MKEKDKTVRRAPLRSIMGKECLKILQTLSMSEDEKRDPHSVVGALEKYFTSKTNVVYENVVYVFGTTNQSTNETVDSMSQDILQIHVSLKPYLMILFVID